jgi:hypothetical protein
MKDWHLARRELLKGLGVGLACLSLLRATRSWAAPAPPPRRLMVIELNHGYRQMSWRPPVGPLATQPLPDSCAPLEPHKQDLIFLPDLANPGVPATTSGHGAFGVMFYGLPSDEGAGGFRQPRGMKA